MILKFHGLVTTGDSCRVSDDPEAHGAIRIGEDDLVGAVQEAVAEREKVRERVPATERAHFDVTGKSIAPGAPKPKPVTFAVADERS